MKINTLVEFIWNPRTEKYEEIYSESYDYNGELALAETVEDIMGSLDYVPGGSGAGGEGAADPWLSSSGYGGADWRPSYEQLTGWVESDAFNEEDLALGFGMEAGSGKYFPPPDWWKAGYLEQELGVAEDKQQLAVKRAERLEDEGWESFDTAVETGVFKADVSMYEIMEQSRQREVQSGFIQDTSRTGGRQRRQTVEGYKTAIESAQKTAKSIEATSGEQIDAANIAYAQAGIDAERGAETEKRNSYDEVWTAYQSADVKGAIEKETGGKTSKEWIQAINDLDPHWENEHLNEYLAYPEFLEWFYNNEDKIDTDWLASDVGELEVAFSDWQSGYDEPQGEGCVVTTALNDTGVWTDSQKYTAVKWCSDTHHDGTARGRAWVRGYHVWGGTLSTFMKKNKIVKFVAKKSTESFMEYEKGERNLFGALIKHTWINPLSYLIGYTKNKSKFLYYIVALLLGISYTVLFPVYSLFALLKDIKDNYG